ncbi:hypothetical protein SAMN05192559_101632 [Halobacillus karajensis]|uniref:Uncharacterized protein n=1 Tax=Halobacillus karajensis TaxID=195088 RepID=A0A024P4H8_9BACI|nr:hypothetical protein BN982_01026 [Halobacillus karajensis]CDQ23181.1 hypothetical protein BN983_01402 [Halobacillus karajensis]CDQ26663.1 hypothetical protein BN981_00882 [Halobacillus karajensis]SEH47089.1 hypothetical protein SAMN05192559_101632 [Halobacillus karajensis]
MLSGCGSKDKMVFLKILKPQIRLYLLTVTVGGFSPGELIALQY